MSSVAQAAAAPQKDGSSSLLLFEALMFVVLLLSGWALRLRRQQLAATQAQRYQRLAHISAAATATAGAATPPTASPRGPGHGRTASSAQ